MIRKLGPVKATVLITVLAILVSVSITTTSILIVYDATVLPFGIILSVLLPGVLAPSIAYVFFRLLAQIDKAQQEREAAIRDLTEALANIRRLSGLLPICASCKKIRDDEGYWHQVEDYIHSHAEVDFSHGFCPDSISRLYPKQQRQHISLKKQSES